MTYPFASQGNFLDLQVSNHEIKHRWTSNIIKEKFIISKHTHTSFSDVDEFLHVERRQVIKYIIEELEARQKAMDAAKEGKS